MIWVDWCVCFVLLVSAAVGVFRGFTRELLGLLGWVLALWLAWQFSDAAATLLESSITTPSIRFAVAAAGLFTAGLMLGALFSWGIGRLIQKSPFAATDRVLGGGFGLLRGVLFAVLFVMLAGLTPLKRDAWWQQSLFIGKLESLAERLEALIPGDWLNRLRSADAAPSKET